MYKIPGRKKENSLESVEGGEEAITAFVKVKKENDRGTDNVRDLRTHSCLHSGRQFNTFTARSVCEVQRSEEPQRGHT